MLNNIKKPAFNLSLFSIILTSFLLFFTFLPAAAGAAADYGKAYQVCGTTACGNSFCDNTGIAYTSYGVTAGSCTYHSWNCTGNSCGTQYADHYWSTSCDKTYADRLATGAGPSVPPRCIPPSVSNLECVVNSTGNGYTLTWNDIPQTSFNVYNGVTKLTSVSGPTYTTTSFNIKNFTVKTVGGGRERSTGTTTACPASPAPAAPACTGLTANPNSLFVGDTSNLSLTGCTNATTYKWTSTCGTLPSTTTSTPTTTWTSPGNGTVCTVTGSACDASGVCSSPYPAPITVNLHDCNATPQTTSACVATISNTCSTNNGTQTAQYTTYNGSTTCNPVNTTQGCTVSSCSVGNICTNGTCIEQATPLEPVVPGTLLAFSIGMDAIGSAGDNVNPNPSSSNQNPVHTTRNLAVQIFDSNNSQVFAQVGSINYNSDQGVFTGTVDLGVNFANGNYTVKVKSDGHLRKLIPGIQNISSALTQPIQMLRVNLVAGDVDSNNALNINDYNILLSCVTSPSIANIDNHALCNTNSNYIKLSDLEDNDVVNEFDYNLFLREYAVQNGD